MPSDHPRTPESPSNTSYLDPSKQVASPRPTHSLPTPDHSINGSMSSLGPEMAADEVSSKRKRDIEDHGDRDQKKMHVEDGRLRIDDLHVDVGKKYFLCKTPHPPAAVNVKQDLYARFGLQDIAKSVARTLPDGSKGVKLRKTYKNHIKDHGLSGAFDSVKKELENPDTLWAMMIAPDEGWDQEHTRGKEIEHGLSDSIQQLMSKAFTMARGPIPKAAWNDSVLGDLAVSATAAEPIRPVQNGAKLQHTQNLGGQRAKNGDIPRPKRNVKKRTYGDSSYEGYGEGYVDDDAQETGYETGEGDDRGGLSRKRPKKSAQNPPGGPRRQDSYGPGMVGA